MHIRSLFQVPEGFLIDDHVYSAVPQFARQPTGLRETPVRYKGFLMKGMLRGTGEQPGEEASGCGVGGSPVLQSVPVELGCISVLVRRICSLAWKAPEPAPLGAVSEASSRGHDRGFSPPLPSPSAENAGARKVPAQ